MALVVKNLPDNEGDVRCRFNPWVRKMPEGGMEGVATSMKEGMATHSDILAWRIPWTEEPGGIQLMGLQRVRYNLSD